MSLTELIALRDRLDAMLQSMVKVLEKSWKKHRRDLRLDLYGKPEVTDAGSDHSCSTGNLTGD